MADSEGGTLSHEQVINLLKRFQENGLDFIKTEHLYNFDGKAGYALGQGQ
jgi:isocitrate dehydrogenase